MIEKLDGRPPREAAGLLSNAFMDHPNDTTRRLDELEIKASFAEDLLDRLNTLVYRQQRLIDTLAQQVAQLRAQATGADGGATRNLRDELPPHY